MTSTVKAYFVGEGISRFTSRAAAARCSMPFYRCSWPMSVTAHVGFFSAGNAIQLPLGSDRLGLLMGTLLRKRITVQAFIAFEDCGPLWRTFTGAIDQWVRQGSHFSKLAFAAVEQ